MAAPKEEKTSEASDINALFQYPTRCKNPPSNKPQPISNQFPKIAPPNETELKFNDSDWAMFQKIHKRYGDRLKVFYPDDTTRFVQGYAHEEQRDIETFKRIDELLKRGFEPQKYPDEWDFRHILDEPMENNGEEESLKAWPVFFYGYDDQGHPVMYDEIGCSNPEDLDKCFDGQMRKLKTFRFRLLRRLHNTKRIQNMRYGYDGSVNDKGGFNGFTKHCIVMDIKNFHAKSLTQKYRELVRGIIGDESNLWPNTLEKMYIINAPWPFRFAWKIISNFIHPITVAKIDILGSDYINTMKKKIALDQIPIKYGGTCELPIQYGYTADIDRDLLDGDYCEQGDPIDPNTISCNKNREKLAQQMAKMTVSDDVKVNEEQAGSSKEDKAKETVKENNEDVEDDEYVKVDGVDKEKTDESKQESTDDQ